AAPLSCLRTIVRRERMSTRVFRSASGYASTARRPSPGSHDGGSCRRGDARRGSFYRRVGVCSVVIAVLVVPIALLGVMLAMHAVEEWLEGGQPLRRTHEVIDAVRRRPVERAP